MRPKPIGTMRLVETAGVSVHGWAGHWRLESSNPWHPLRDGYRRQRDAVAAGERLLAVGPVTVEEARRLLAEWAEEAKP